MPEISEFKKLGQAIWIDYLRRSFITSGELKELVGKGLSGVTSNQTIFEKAIAGSKDYDFDIVRLVDQQPKKLTSEIYESLAFRDISLAADALKSVYDSSEGADGFVSIEVDPNLANESRGMIDEARRYYKTLNKRNVMIKIPATEAGFQTIKTLIGEGINVNVTLIFSIDQYGKAAESYISGLEDFAKSGGNLKDVSSVASFFVSRVDTAVDKALDKIAKESGKREADELKGKIGISNSRIAYAKFREIFKGPRWEKLEEEGARVQRVLWASTSTKDPSYPDTLYLDNLIGKDTVNTLPPETLNALLDHGVAEPTLDSGLGIAKKEMRELSELGIDFKRITDQLEDEGITKFSKSLDSLYDKLEQKRELILSMPPGGEIKTAGGSSTVIQNEVDSALNDIVSKNVIRRIWNHDFTVWKSEPDEITNRLGWLHISEMMEENVHRLDDLVDSARASGYTQALLVGMGGSSLAPQVFSKTFGTAEGFLELSVLDSTDPSTVRASLRGLDLEKTLVIVSSKSGKTLETLSLFKFFYNKVLEKVGKEKTGEHFIVITDAGTELDTTATKYQFRAKFLNDPNIGGRYSALSYFGLVPASLIGLDVRRLLDNALTMASACESSVNPKDNPGAWLGATIGGLAVEGRDKLTIVASPRLESLCDWIEQLIAESTGKESKGILPVVGEKLGSPETYGKDRLFVHIQLFGDKAEEEKLSKLESAGELIVRLRLRDPYEIGKQFFQWEFATAVAGHILGINPFDQPNVESSKELARQTISQYLEKGTLPSETALITGEDLNIFGKAAEGLSGENPIEDLLSFVEKYKKSGSYIALQPYIQRNPETNNDLEDIRTFLRNKYRLATTLGYGPRFLHSTGQLHKGDAGLGLFIQFTATTDQQNDIPIPEEPGSPKSSISFGILTAAEALGDRQALEKNGRKVIRVDLGKDIGKNLAKIGENLSSHEEAIRN